MINEDWSRASDDPGINLPFVCIDCFCFCSILSSCRAPLSSAGVEHPPPPTHTHTDTYPTPTSPDCFPTATDRWVILSTFNGGMFGWSDEQVSPLKKTTIKMKMAGRVQLECTMIPLYSGWICFISFIFLAQSSPQGQWALGSAAGEGRSCYSCVAMGIWYGLCWRESHNPVCGQKRKKKRMKK